MYKPESLKGLSYESSFQNYFRIPLINFMVLAFSYTTFNSFMTEAVII